MAEAAERPAKVAGEPNLASFDNRWGDAGYIAGAVAARVGVYGGRNAILWAQRDRVARCYAPLRGRADR